MAKDPAFLFYTSDFVMGTNLFTDEQVGKYIRLLCQQHQSGHLSEKDMLKICKTHDEDIWRKFLKDDDGLYYNERLEIEHKKRQNYSKSRSENRSNKGTKVKPVKKKKTSKSYVRHMENENEDVITLSIPVYELIYNEQNEKFSNVFFEEWCKLCQTKKWRVKEKSAIETSFKKLKKYQEQFAIDLIQSAISGEYQGITFPDTDERYKKWQSSNNDGTTKRMVI